MPRTSTPLLPWRGTPHLLSPPQTCDVPSPPPRGASLLPARPRQGRAPRSLHCSAPHTPARPPPSPTPTTALPLGTGSRPGRVPLTCIDNSSPSQQAAGFPILKENTFSPPASSCQLPSNFCFCKTPSEVPKRRPPLPVPPPQRGVRAPSPSPHDHPLKTPTAPPMNTVASPRSPSAPPTCSAGRAPSASPHWPLSSEDRPP